MTPLLAAAYERPLSGLSTNEVLLLRVLAYLANDDQWVNQTNGEIAVYCQYRERTTVSRLLTRLATKGYINRTGDRSSRAIKVASPNEWPVS